MAQGAGICDTFDQIRHWVQRRSQALSVLLTVGILSLLVWQLLRSWRQLPAGFFATVSYGLLLASLVSLAAALLLVSLRWWLTLQAMGIPLELRESLRIWFLSQAGRYVPGGIWTYVGRYLLSRSQISGESIAASLILEVGLRVMSEALVFLVSVPFWFGADQVRGIMVSLLAVAFFLGPLFLHPKVLSFLSGASIVRGLGLRPLDISHMRYHAILGLLAYYTLTVVAVGGAFYLLVRALYPVPISLLPALTGALAGSVVLGFLVPLAPNGWGIREGVMSLLLARIMPSSVAVLVSMAARVWLTVGEAVWILPSILTQKADRLE